MIWFVENLSLGVWARLLLPRMMRSGRAQGCDRVFWIDSSRAGTLVGPLLGALVDARVERLDFRLIELHDENGLLLQLRLAFEDLFGVQEAAISEPAFAFALRGAAGKGRLGSFLKKAPVVISLEHRTLWRALYLLYVADWKRREMRAQRTEACIVLEDQAWLESLDETAARLQIPIEKVACGPLDRGFASLLGPRLSAQLVWCREQVRHLRFAGQGLIGRRSGEHAGSRAAVQFTGQLNLDSPSLYSDLFFWQASKLPASAMLLFTGLPQSPIDDRRCDELKRHGIDVVALYSKATSTPTVPLFLRWPQRAGTSIRLGPDTPSDQARWLARQLETYDVLRDYWEAFCRENDVGVFLSWYRFDQRHLAIADGVESAGGITAIYQRALQFDASPSIAIDADLMFGYAPADAEVERRSGSNIAYHVAVGYFGDHRPPLLREKAIGVRQSLGANGAEFVLAYFDENSATDARWQTGHEFMRANYEFLLGKVLSEPWFGLAIKPKVPSTLRQRLGSTRKLLEEALATGRCYLYEAGSLHGSEPPTAAALAADVALHGHLAAGTAGLEAALAGVPTLLLDREGWTVSPLYRLGVGRVIFHDLPTLWDALGEHRSRPGAVSGFGDWSPMLDQMDPFRDGRAAERMGTYIQWLIEGLAAGEGRESVLARTAERYQKRWGTDKVRRVVSNLVARAPIDCGANRCGARLAEPVAGH